MRLYLLKFTAFFLGCYSCFLLQTEAGLSPVLASALTGFAGSFLHFPAFFERKGLHSAIYAGTFAGMCSHSLISSTLHVVILSLIGAATYLLAQPHLNGFGGKLGTISFISSILFLIASYAW